MVALLLLWVFCMSPRLVVTNIIATLAGAITILAGAIYLVELSKALLRLFSSSRYWESLRYSNLSRTLLKV